MAFLNNSYIRELKGQRDDVRSELIVWAALSGQDRCWHHPEILERLCAIMGIAVEPTRLPPRCEFEAGCRKYTSELYGNSEELLFDPIAAHDRVPSPEQWRPLPAHPRVP